MAEGFAAADYVTGLRLADVRGKRLWLLRVPKHFDAENLEGVTVKLPLRKGREGKVLGTVKPATQRNSEHGREGEGLVFRAADSAESCGFRALFTTTDDDGALASAAPFAGQVNVSIEPPTLEEAGEIGEEPLAAMVEPYRGRPQLKGMRVRAKFAGTGSEYTRSQPMDERQPLIAPTAPTDHEPRNKKADPAEVIDALQQSPASPKGSKKKKKKRKSSAAGGAAAGASAGKKSKRKSV